MWVRELINGKTRREMVKLSKSNFVKSDIIVTKCDTSRF